MIIERKRKAERYMVQKMGLAQINRKINTNLMINDISMRGISLLCGDNIVKEGDGIKLSFFANGGKRLAVECMVVRLFEIHGIKAAGCVFRNVSTDIITYVLDKKAEHDRKLNVKVAG
ncbi:MAG: PilZ domain-containing protein [Butyrivibrio sp.]|nr:PilZ domain-containing protein [Butyrivibrio sp.]